MRIRRIGIISLCALIILGTVANPVAAQVRTVGVSIGNTFKYDAIFSWSSNDPNATMPPYYEVVNETEWMSASVVNISNTSVSVQERTHFKNGTEVTQLNVIDVDTGDGNMTYWIVSANLGVNDTVYTSGTYSTWRINETIVRTYPGGMRNTNHVNITMELTSNSSYMYASTNLYWDRSTGVIVEIEGILNSRVAGIESNMTAILTIIESNLWVVPEFSAFASVLTLMIAAAVVFVSHKRRLSKTRIV